MNFRELAENLRLEEEQYMELVELLVETGTSDLEKLQSAIDEGDAEKAVNAAHSLKGAAGNLGLMELHKVAEDIEEKARNNRLEGTAEASQTLKAKFHEISEFIRS